MTIKKKLPWLPGDENMTAYEIITAHHIHDIPKDLWDIFAAQTSLEDMKNFARNIACWKEKSKDRRKVFDLCITYKLPLKYRRMSLRYVQIYVNVIKLKATRKYADKRNQDDPE